MRNGCARHVDTLTNIHEASSPAPWKVADAPADYIDGMLKAIVGFELPIVRLEGKWKVSQNRPAADREGVVQALDALDTPRSCAMARLVERRVRVPPLLDQGRESGDVLEQVNDGRKSKENAEHQQRERRCADSAYRNGSPSQLLLQKKPRREPHQNRKLSIRRKAGPSVDRSSGCS